MRRQIPGPGLEMPALLSLTIGRGKTNLKNFLPLLSFGRDPTNALWLGVGYGLGRSHPIRVYGGTDTQGARLAKAHLYKEMAGRGAIPRPAL